MRKHRKFHREKNQRRALLRSLAVALILRKKIKTTEARAKELRSVAERLVTYAKKWGGAQAAFRKIEKLVNKTSARKLIIDIAPKYAARNGGYTRILKIGRRRGDAARMAYIEWV